MIRAYRGDDIDIILYVTDANGSAYDCSGCTLLFDAKALPDIEGSSTESDALIAKTITCVAGAYQTIPLAPADTKDLEAMTYMVGVKLIKSGKSYTVCTDQMTLDAEVVRRYS